jgi:pimeloyl-ACP methyl ester carboxylesterase
MLVDFVHGWGVRKADYGSLPELLGVHTIEICLTEYISYCDDVTMTDLADTFERVRLAKFPQRKFACVTHSTGGPVMRTWLDRYDGPMTALVMLAPPNHGSALAQLGKGRLSRLKSWMEGVEPGQRILDWLELGSDESWALNKRWLDSQWPGRMLVLTGSAPDRSLYDHLNSYTGERGSDGVVRMAAANLNYRLLRFRQSGEKLELVESTRSPETSFLILPGASHARILDLDASEHAVPAASMIIFKIVDSSGHPVENYDLLLTAGSDNSPDALPNGFFIDRQRNGPARNTLTYFVDYAAMAQLTHLGFAVYPRPGSGPVSYAPAHFRADMFLRPNETTMIEITLERLLEDRVFTIQDCE